MDRFLCKYSLLMKFLCIHYVYTGSEYIYLDVCACMGARVFFGISTVVAVHDFFVFFFRSSAYYGNTFLLLLSVPVLHTFFCVLFNRPKYRIYSLYVRAICNCFFFRLEAAFFFTNMFVRTIAIKFCVSVCRIQQKRMFYNFYTPLLSDVHIDITAPIFESHVFPHAKIHTSTNTHQFYLKYHTHTHMHIQYCPFCIEASANMLLTRNI